MDRDLRARSADEPAQARPEVALHPGGQWKLVVEATMFVTCANVFVWSGVELGGNDPAGVYTRMDGLDTTGTLMVEAV